MKKLLTQESSSSSKFQNSKMNGYFGGLLLLLLSVVLIPNQMNADVVGVSYFYPTITVFADDTWAIISSDTLTMTGFQVGHASSVTWNSDSLKFYATVKASNNNIRRLVTVNPATGVCTDIGSMGGNFITLTYSSITKTLYTMGDDEKLYRVDMTNGATTFLGGPYPVGGNDEVISYNYDDGFIYHWSGGSDAGMEKINTTTFIATPIVQTGIYHFQIMGAVYQGGGVFLATEQERALRITSAGVVSVQSEVLPFYIRGLGYPDSTLPKTLHLTALLEGFYNDAANKMISDTARVYLRNITSPYSIIDSSKSILDSNGRGDFSFSNSAGNGTPYYIVIKHRNSIETWSSGGNRFSLNDMTYNFTTAKSKAYGDNLVLKGGRYCIQSGDCNQDGVIDGTDQLMMENAIYSSTTGYVSTDVNGDLIVDGSDAIIIENNAGRFATVQSPLYDQMPQNMPGQSKEKTSSTNSNNGFKLNDNYPNPFNPSTVMSYQLAISGDVSLKVYDLVGKEVASLVNQIQNAGKYSVTFNASGLASGMYFYKLQANGFSQVKKMMLLK